MPKRFRLLALGLTVAVAGAGAAAAASAATLAPVWIDQASLSSPAVNAAHNAFGPLQTGQSDAEVFVTTQAFSQVGASVPTWTTKTSGGTLILRDGAGLTGTVVAQHVFTDVADGSTLVLALSAPAPAGTYTLELADPTGPSPLGSPPQGAAIGWWGSSTMVSGDYALINGQKQADELVMEYLPVAASAATTTPASSTAASSTASSTATAPAASSATTPQTGEGPALPVGAGLLLAAGLGLAFFRRRPQAR